ncbi:NAD-dependent protein deacetylase sirtuin-2 [Mortierella polycephala]|uniref:NAD-dependent protein deacetylase sirtuin-2 n=1 Tax=Mortierella polycephala TaxID=41804 RepID=A0A9P6TWA8_9FUNG|nr:NAD-dependent protein deacetylase sirtuin-2 [Mortierella polycephala]
MASKTTTRIPIKSRPLKPKPEPEPRIQILKNGTIDAIAELINDNKVKNIIVMTGAGVSTSAGIKDFRSPGTGLYDDLAKYNLPFPEAVFDLEFFKQSPRPFYQLAKELYPGRYRPTLTHYLLPLLVKKKLLLRSYTQNIDSLERLAGLDEALLVEAHGSFANSKCVQCEMTTDSAWVKEHILKGDVPYCKRCSGLVKPGITFFGESVPRRFTTMAETDFEQCDLLMVLGTSLKVEPFNRLIAKVSPKCPRLLINREKAGQELHSGFDFDDKWKYTVQRDALFLGNCDEGVRRLAALCGWEEELQAMYEAGNTHLEHLENIKEPKMKTKKDNGDENEDQDKDDVDIEEGTAVEISDTSDSLDEIMDRFEKSTLISQPETFSCPLTLTGNHAGIVDIKHEMNTSSTSKVEEGLERSNFNYTQLAEKNRVCSTQEEFTVASSIVTTTTTTTATATATASTTTTTTTTATTTTTTETSTAAVTASSTAITAVESSPPTSPAPAPLEVEFLDKRYKEQSSGELASHSKSEMNAPYSQGIQEADPIQPSSETAEESVVCSRTEESASSNNISNESQGTVNTVTKGSISVKLAEDGTKNQSNDTAYGTSGPSPISSGTESPLSPLPQHSVTDSGSSTSLEVSLASSSSSVYVPLTVDVGSSGIRQPLSACVPVIAISTGSGSGVVASTLTKCHAFCNSNTIDNDNTSNSKIDNSNSNSDIDNDNDSNSSVSSSVNIANNDNRIIGSNDGPGPLQMMRRKRRKDFEHVSCAGSLKGEYRYLRGGGRLPPHYLACRVTKRQRYV